MGKTMSAVAVLCLALTAACAQRPTTLPEPVPDVTDRTGPDSAFACASEPRFTWSDTKTTDQLTRVAVVDVSAADRTESDHQGLYEIMPGIVGVKLTDDLRVRAFDSLGEQLGRPVSDSPPTTELELTTWDTARKPGRYVAYLSLTEVTASITVDCGERTAEGVLTGWMSAGQGILLCTVTPPAGSLAAQVRERYCAE